MKRSDTEFCGIGNLAVAPGPLGSSRCAPLTPLDPRQLGIHPIPLAPQEK
jgi:hypothetical protein